MNGTLGQLSVGSYAFAIDDAVLGFGVVSGYTYLRLIVRVKRMNFVVVPALATRKCHESEQKLR